MLQESAGYVPPTTLGFYMQGLTLEAAATYEVAKSMWDYLKGVRRILPQRPGAAAGYNPKPTAGAVGSAGEGVTATPSLLQLLEGLGGEDTTTTAQTQPWSEAEGLGTRILNE